MNTVVTSREAILQASRELIHEQGWTAVNIRAIARTCNISVGSIYNYFQSKSDLIAAIVESVWHDVFHFPESEESFESFTACIEWIFDCMEKGDEKYPGFFSLHSMSFIGEEKTNGQQLMAQAWAHIQDKLYIVLLHDKDVRQETFDESFTPRKFVEIIFSLLFSALLQQNYDCTAIVGMIGRIIYP